MKTVFPLSTPIGPQPSLSQPMGFIPTAPPSLQRLAVGKKLEAVVLQGMIKGFAEIDTPFGNLKFTTTFPLRPQTNLQLQVIGKFPCMQLLIISIQGKNPLSELQTLPTDNSTKSPSSVRDLSSGASPSKLHSEHSKSISLIVGANILATKTAINLTPASHLNPQGIKAAPKSKLDVAPAYNSPGAQIAIGTKKSPPIQNIDKKYSIENTFNKTVSQFSVRITKVLSPAQLSRGGGLPATESNKLTVGQLITGVVTMTTAQGHSIVQTHSGPISLATPNFLPPGTTISFLITTGLNSISREKLSGMADRNSEFIMGTNRWPKLDDALRTLSESHPTLGQQVINSILPKAGTGLAANIILLVSAIRHGDIKAWLGDAPVRALQRIKPELMSRLRDDFSQINLLSDDNISNTWRSYPIPFLNGQEIEQIWLYIKCKSESDKDSETPDQGTRFILDLDLTYIGRLQLDGLVQSTQKQFDLILRTDNPIHQMLQNGIRDIFQKAIEQTGHIGGLTFQSEPAIFTNIQSDRIRPPSAGFIA